MRELNKLLKAHKIEIDPVGLFDFMQSGIELRELAKFKFSRNLSDAMSLINEFGNKLDLIKKILYIVTILSLENFMLQL